MKDFSVHFKFEPIVPVAAANMVTGEVKIDPVKWEKFSEGEKYNIIAHEAAHQYYWHNRKED